MMRGADHGAVVAPVVTAARTEAKVVIMEVPPRAARRHRATPAVAGEHWIVMAGCALPMDDDVSEQAFECRPARFGRIGEGVEHVTQQRHDGGRTGEADLGVADLERLAVRGRGVTIPGVNARARARDAHERATLARAMPDPTACAPICSRAAGDESRHRSGEVTRTGDGNRLSTGGGARETLGPSASREASTHSTSSFRRRTVTSSARAIHAAAFVRSSTGSSESARTHDSRPSRYARPKSSLRAPPFRS